MNESTARILALPRSVVPRQLLTLHSVVLLVACAVLLLSPTLKADTTELAPSSDYRPQEVVQIVINALQENSPALEDSGIATVFRFASPGNRALTGPLPRFTRMIKRGYPDMLNHAGARYDAMEITDDTAVQAVWLMQASGKELGYAFQLSRQAGGAYEGMWMTDTVLPLGPGERSGTRI